MHRCQWLILAGLCVCTLFAASLIAVPSAFSKEDCHDYYFGISGPPNFPKALKCYRDRTQQADSDDYGEAMEFLILMHLNGEGVQANVRRAEELFKAWQQHELGYGRGYWLNDHPLKQVIEERKQYPRKRYPRVEYCGDISDYPTAKKEFCTDINSQIAESKLKRTMAVIRAKLVASDATLLDQILAEFAVHKDAEKRRVQEEIGPAEWAYLRAKWHEMFMRDNLLELVQETFERHRLQAANEGAYKAADDELNQVYRERIQSYTDVWSEDSYYSEPIDFLKRKVEGYKESAKQSQLHWVKYRELWAELARRLYKDKTRDVDPALSMKTTVTKIRLRELGFNPFE